jgi:hypothetical protein
MIESWVLIEGQNVNRDTLQSVSLMNAKQLVVGGVPGSGVILHVAASSSVDLGNALLAFSEVPGVTGVSTLALRTRQ